MVSYWMRCMPSRSQTPVVGRRSREARVGASGSRFRRRGRFQPERLWGGERLRRWCGRVGHALRSEIRAIDSIHGREVAEILEKYGGLDRFGKAASARFKDGLEVLKDLGGLLGDAAGYHLLGGRVECDLAGGEDQVAGPHALGIGSDGGGGLVGCDDCFAHGLIVMANATCGGADARGRLALALLLPTLATETIARMGHPRSVFRVPYLWAGTIVQTIATGRAGRR